MSHELTVQYALMCLQELEAQGSKPVSSKEISDRQGVPLPECEGILERLSDSGIVRAVRPDDFVLARPIDQLTALDVLQAIGMERKKEPAFKMLFQADKPGLRMTLKALACSQVRG